MTSGEASWIGERLHPFARDVGSVVPPGFEAYARVFHPPAFLEPDHTLRPVRWRDIAAANHRSIQEEMRLLGISCEPANLSSEGAVLWNHQPRVGRTPYDIAVRLVSLLGGFTSTPERCWFGVWEGFGDLRIFGSTDSTLSLPQRNYILLQGHLVDALHTLSDVDWIYLAPNLWWPEDRAWCVATEIDFAWTYVGGTRACIQQILDDPQLEALPTSPNEGNFMQSGDVGVRRD